MRANSQRFRHRQRHRHRAEKCSDNGAQSERACPSVPMRLRRTSCESLACGRCGSRKAKSMLKRTCERQSFARLRTTRGMLVARSAFRKADLPARRALAVPEQQTVIELKRQDDHTSAMAWARGCLRRRASRLAGRSHNVGMQRTVRARGPSPKQMRYTRPRRTVRGRSSHNQRPHIG